MGAAGSVQSNEMDSDPWWSTRPSPQQSASNGLTEDEGATHTDPGNKDNEETAVGEELWLKQIQDLGKIIQNLASDNLKLLDSNNRLKQECEEQENRLSERICSEKQKEEESFENLQIVINSQEEAANDKKLIENLKLQLQIKTENSAVEVEKYHKKLNLMHMTVKEYEQVIEKLEKDAAIQNDAIQSLQCSLLPSDNQGNAAEQSTLGMKEAIETLKQEHKDCLEENKELKEELKKERNTRKIISDDNKKLQEELQRIKQIIRFHTLKRTSENSDADSSDVDINGETEQPVASSSSSKIEETRTLSPRATAELEVFQKQMKVKREARHKALSAISMEMERLRRELNSEREVRRNVVKELDNVKNMSDAHHIYEEMNDLKHKLTSERQEKDRIYKEMVEMQKQGNEEIENILKQLEKEKAKTERIMGENKYIKEQLEESDNMLQLRSEENTQLQNKLDTDKEKFQQQVLALKDVVAISKQMLTVRENQVTHLKQTLQDIEVSVIEKHRGSLTAGLRAEYETQMENIKALKTLYEERMQVMNVEKDRLISEQKDLQRLIEEEKRSVEDLETKLQEKEEIITERNATVSDLQDQLSDAIDQSRNLSYELSLINNMFTQILGSSDMDLDRLTKLLQENHDLITEITTKGDCSETTASLPKLLLDLVCHAENAENNTNEEQGECSNGNSSCTPVHTVSTEQSEAAGPVISVNTSGPLAMQDISSNLPKVWKVLLELVSHHIPSPSEESSEESKTSCYKSVDTPYGPKNVISVSKTFLRLRDLILQKKSLQKEVTRFKQLNVHLETKLNDQERRLSLVSTELRKTWNVVDNMRIQHQQLHTHEKVLRYELQQKRKLLMELKEELEYCREKWEDARQKNSQSEIEWQILRKEFALRKNKPLNNSGESGFSEEKDEDGSDNDVTKLQSQRKPSNSGLNSVSFGNCIDQTIIKPDDPENVTNSTTSLPDLVAVAADLPIPPSDVTVPIDAIASDDVMNSTREDSIPLLQNIVQDTFSLDNGNNDSTILESSLLEECPTVSLVTLLKQQLSSFSKNIEIITNGFNTDDHFRALQSIFALPAIQIPEHLDTSSEEPTTSFRKINNFDTLTRASVDRGIQVAEECRDNTGEAEESVCGRILPHSSEGTVTLQEQEKSNENSVKISCSSSSSCDTEGQENGPTSSVENVEQIVSFDDTDTHSSSENIQKESRSERMQRLERQCQQLFDKVTCRSNTSSTTSEPKNRNESQEGSSGSARNFEDMLDARAARLKRLEEQSQQLFKKVTRTTHRSVALSNRLEELHEQYGSEDASENVAADNAVAQRTPSNLSTSIIPDAPPLPNNLVPSKFSTHDSSEDNAISLPGPSTSSSNIPPPTLEDRLDARAARLKRLEEQSQQLFNKVARTTHRSAALSNRLEELHGQYGSEEAAGNAAIPTHACSDRSSSNSPPLADNLVQAYSSVPATSQAGMKNTQVEQTESPCPSPSTSSHIPTPPPLEDKLDAHTTRSKRLEEQSQQPFKKSTTHCSTELSNRLELHDQYGREDSTENATNHSASNIPNPPPLPEYLVARKLPTPCLPSTSSHIPTPPSLPLVLPTARLPTEIDRPTRHDNAEEEEVYSEEKEQR